MIYRIIYIRHKCYDMVNLIVDVESYNGRERFNVLLYGYLDNNNNILLYFIKTTQLYCVYKVSQMYLTNAIAFIIFINFISFCF